MAIAGVLPTVAGDLELPADSAGRQHDRLRTKQVKSAAFAVVAERTSNAAAVFKERDHRMLHEDVQSEMDAMVLERANHLQPGAVAHVRESRVAMSTKIPLQNAAVLGAVKQRAPSFEFAHAIGCFFGV